MPSTPKTPAQILGTIGGSKGTGEAKKRTTAHYRRISRLAHEARWGKKKVKKP